MKVWKVCLIMVLAMGLVGCGGSSTDVKESEESTSTGDGGSVLTFTKQVVTHTHTHACPTVGCGCDSVTTITVTNTGTEPVDVTVADTGFATAHMVVFCSGTAMATATIQPGESNDIKVQFCCDNDDVFESGNIVLTWTANGQQQTATIADVTINAA